MKIKIKFLTIIIGFLLGCSTILSSVNPVFFSSIIKGEFELQPNSAAPVWDEIGIVINSNLDFVSEATTGDGSVGNPWRIHGKYINASNGVGINITHTTDYFVVEDSVIKNASHGIYINNVSNGILKNITIYNCSETGIFLDGQSNTFFNGVHEIEIRENVIHGISGASENSGNGIRLDWECKNNYIYNNTIYDNFGTQNGTGNGIYIVGDALDGGGCNNNIIENNLIYDNTATVARKAGNGVFFDGDCINNEIKGNTIFGSSSVSGFWSGNGICFLQHCSANTISNNTIYDNEGGVEGIPLQDGYSGNGISIFSDNDYTDIINNTIHSSHGGTSSYQGNGIYITDSTNCNIKDNIIYGNMAGDGTDSGNGIMTQFATNLNISNNYIYENYGNDKYYTGNGILLSSYSDNSYIAENIIRDSIGGTNQSGGNGIILTNSNDSIITQNNISYCTGDFYIESGSGILIRVGDNINISYNKIDFCSGYAVELGFSENCNVSYNSFYGNGEYPCILSYVDNIITPNYCLFLGTILNYVDTGNWDGIATLNWTGPSWAEFYYVFRSTSEITTENYMNLTPIATVTTTTFTDNLTEEGTYYYAILAANATLNGTISNCIAGEILIATSGNEIPFSILPGLLMAVVFVVFKTYWLKKVKKVNCS
ncbi:right-handed parallel beta-helix repeat-containing protein [Promethearchaeum syntrophicum]|uniref:Right-handed parallel beta-helix repeat-containing protein n=1 Tax=Promethearchaeum syntrophicum TaxID=2594042 RepID=A0A5B9DCU3_9ARCH|nr:right-handed parallel beta-helix repeat-containing protein [Candidatus Prometheoarchaeum syntrophicum]QEE16526.1 hypothetical protein DSAG12_02356 [Candidatus Prometheoarchaeum syntrophicum]